MCQKLKEQTDQLKTKIQEFSKSIAQDSPYHLQDKRLVIIFTHFTSMLTISRRSGLNVYGVLCTFYRRENTEKKGHRRTNCGRCPPAIQGKALLADSILSSDAGPSSSSASGTGLQSNKCDNCGTKSHNSRRVCGKKPLEEFHYRYNMPGQNYLNPNERSAFVKLYFLNENKNSSPCWSPRHAGPASHRPLLPFGGALKNLKVFMTYNSDLATPSPHFHFCRISGSKSLSNFGSMEETESEILNSSLDHALRTASILKETTDRMIRTIAEDLAKIQRWRNRLKY
uniref:AKNA domain-containing protein n=1 Tax=Ailuropoda melanoleuca TaxID=9646 RepID=A0A7N5JBI3_AILME